MFYDGQYNNITAKEKIFKQWQKFLEGGCQEKDFKSDLYKHLHLHFGFIAHYNQGGFYENRFDMTNFDGVTDTFDRIIGAQSVYFIDANTSGNADLNRAIQREAINKWPEIQEIARSKTVGRLEGRMKADADKIEGLLKKPLST